MQAFRLITVLVLAAALAACAPSKFKRYNGPEVTSVQVHKNSRRMYLLHHQTVLAAYDIALGFAPEGHKQFEGDGKTPEGSYTISYKNPDSEYHLSLMIDYPNDTDRAYASSMDKTPGGDIFIHGGPNKRISQRDWTAGCISVSDKEMEIVYSMVREGTPIHILP